MKNQIKYLQNLFYGLLNDYGRVFIVVKHSERTAIGKRGFTDEEKEKGLLLVLNNKNHKAIQWADDGSLITTLGFGPHNKPEQCFIHSDDVVAVYSPDAQIRFDRWDILENDGSSQEPLVPQQQEKKQFHNGKVVSLNNFRKTKT